MTESAVYPDLKISICDQQPSGYFREDTIGSPNPIQRTGASAYYIPNEGNGIRFVKVTENTRTIIPNHIAIKTIDNKEEGYEQIVAEQYPIRYIKDCPSIDLEWQNSHNWKPRINPKSDEIVLEDCYMELSYQKNPAMYLYLKSIMWNKSLPFRLENIAPLFYEVKENIKAVIDISKEFAINEATSEWQKLVTKTDKGVSLNEEKINGYCGLLNLQGKTVQDRLHALLAKAKTDPVGFLTQIRQYQEETITDVCNAEQLGLFKFEGDTAVLFSGKKIQLSGAKNKATKIEKLADALKTTEYAETYTLLKNKIQLEKEKKLN